jgi:hypothetical protein
MKLNPTKIVIIHDTLAEDEPIVVELQDKYGDENVKLFHYSKEGLNYLTNNADQRMVILLDVNLSPGDKKGVQIFNEIKRENSLVYVIMITANDIRSAIDKSDWKTMVNNHAFAVASSVDEVEELLALVDKAVYELDVSVACVLEQWISNRTDEQLKTPYLLTGDGNEYTLGEILEEIRHKTKVGLKMERNILLLAIEVLTGGGQVDSNG